MTQNRSMGGLQFKNLKNFNRAMLAKQGMRLLNNPNSLCSRVLKAKYFPNDNFMEAKLGNNPSFAWRSIIEGRKIIDRGSRWKLGDGRTFRVKDRWIPSLPNCKPITTLVNNDNGYVRDLLDISGTLWDRQKLEGKFWPVDVEAILKIPIPRIPVADKLIWNGTKNGIYSVKTGYELACHMENNSEEGTSNNKEGLFSKLWSTKVQRKNLHFVWRAIHRSIPTVNNLRRRGIQIDRVCRRCLTKDEDESHCFIRCSNSKQVWDILIPGNDFQSYKLPFHSWLEHQISQGTSKHRRLIFTTIYSLWLARNKAVFEHSITPPAAIVHTVVSRLDELDSSGLIRSKPTGVPSRRQKNWERPPTQSIKLNFDAGFDKNTMQGVGGFVARDAMGRVLIAGSFDFGYCIDVNHAEALAGQKAMDSAIMMGFTSVIFEGDCQIVIEEIIRRRQGKPAQDFTEVEDVINGFLLGSTALADWSIQFTRRENNSLAHYLASRRKILDSDLLIFPPIPGWLETLAGSDVTLSDAPP